MSLAQSLAAHGIHMFHDRADYIAYMPNGGPAPTLATADVYCVQGEIKAKHKVRMYNLDQAFNGGKFDLRDYPSMCAFAADIIQEILTANYHSLPDDLRHALERSW